MILNQHLKHLQTHAALLPTSSDLIFVFLDETMK